MESTMQLLYKALEREPSAKFWCEQLLISRNTLAVAKIRGRLSPTIAGNLARLIGEDTQKWVTIAAMEGEPDTYGKWKVIETIEKRWNDAASKMNRQITSLYLTLGARAHRPRFSAL